jgi:TonB-linked SusC/RagA family outer membrane protein
MKKFLLALSLSILACAVYAQERTVTGTVTSEEDGSGLPGVNVILKGTTIGTATDAQGNYSIAVPARGGSLVFTFIGLGSKEIDIGDRSLINVTLALDVTQLGEVVVTALGVERERKTLGFSVRDLNSEELTTARTTNVVNALSGKVAGVRVAGSNGMTGASSAIFIRGFTTFTGSNQPLFVVDGVPINNGGGAMAMQTGVSNSNRAIDINQDDIESMTVLKGPAAAALYGSRAASGVIIIKTRSGKSSTAGKNTVEYTGSYNINEPNRLPDYQNRYAQGTSLINATTPRTDGLFQPNADQSNWGPVIAGQMVPSAYSAADQLLFGLPAEVPLTAYPDNVKDLFRTGYNMQHNIAFSGANDKSDFFFSYNNLRDKGFLEGNLLTRHSFRFSGNTQLTDKFKMGVSFNYINSPSERSQTGNQLSNPLFRGWFMPRNYNLQGDPYQRPDGSQVYFNSVTDNPYWTLKNNLFKDEVNRLIGNFDLRYDFNDWLAVTYKLGTDAFYQQIKTVDAKGARGQANHAVQGVGAIGDRSIFNQESSSYLNFLLNKDLTSDIALNALIGNEVNLVVRNDHGFFGNTTSTYGFDNITDATNYVPNPASNIRSRRNLVGLYADLQLNYRKWFYFGVTGRNDWSSTFKKGNNSYFYPSVTSSFILTEAVPALKTKALSYAKVKANWAKVGREADPYLTDTYYVLANPADGFGPQVTFPFRNRLGRSLSNTLGNAELGPEFTRSFEVGTEATLFGDRVRLDLTYFSTRSTDIIINVPVAGASGFLNQSQNAGTLETHGVEISAGATPVKAGAFTWTIDLNWSRIRNNVLELAPGVQNIGIGGFTTAQTRIEAGKEYGVIYANTLLRDDQGRLVINPTTGLPIPDTRGVQYVGNPNPRWTGGMTNTFSWKGVKATFLLDVRYGGDILSRVINDLRRTGTAEETAAVPRFDENGAPLKNYLIDGVTSDGLPNTTYITAQQYWSNLYDFNVPGMGVFDASWVRLREVSIFYSLPQSLIAKTPFGKVEIGVNGRNLALWTDVPHIDPETNLTGASNSQGLEFNTMPNARSYGGVLKLTF